MGLVDDQQVAVARLGAGGEQLGDLVGAVVGVAFARGVGGQGAKERGLDLVGAQRLARGAAGLARVRLDDDEALAVLGGGVLFKVKAQGGFAGAGLAHDGHVFPQVGRAVQRIAHVADVGAGEHVGGGLHVVQAEQVRGKAPALAGGLVDAFAAD